jgi:hypothetical protein
MKFGGSLIEELMATVERAERRAQSDEASACKSTLGESLATETMVDPWFASAQANADYDTKLLGVA